MKEVHENQSSFNRKLIYGVVFTLANTVVCALITNDFNPWHLILLLVIFSITVIVILFDQFESKLSNNTKAVFEKWISLPVLFIVIILVIISSIVSVFIPNWSTKVNETVVVNMPYVSSTIAFIAIVLIFKRELDFRKMVVDKEVDLNNQILTLKGLTENLININDRLIKYNPLYSTESTFKNAIEHLKDVSVADVALNFSIESLKQIGTLGFLKIDVSFGEYTKKLFDIVAKSRNSVVGSFTFRPHFIYDEISKDNDEVNNCKLKYLKLLKEKDYSKKVRLVILTTNEIRDILKDALKNMSKKSNAKFYEIPEIEWFVNHASQGFKVYWTSKNQFYSQFLDNKQDELKNLIALPDQSITDFAIFDGDLLISWRKSIEKESDIADFGTLLISWNPSISKFCEELIEDNIIHSSKNLYTNFMSLVNVVAKDDREIRELADNITQKKYKGYRWDNEYLPF